MGSRRDDISPETARRIAELLREESVEADRVAAPLYVLQLAYEHLTDEGAIDPTRGDFLDWDENGFLVVRRGPSDGGVASLDGERRPPATLSELPLAPCHETEATPMEVLTLMVQGAGVPIGVLATAALSGTLPGGLRAFVEDGSHWHLAAIDAARLEVSILMESTPRRGRLEAVLANGGEVIELPELDASGRFLLNQETLQRLTANGGMLRLLAAPAP